MRNLVVASSTFFFFFMLISIGDFKKKIQFFPSKKISQIKIENMNLINKEFILKSISLKEGESFWKFNPFQLKKDLNSLNEIKSFKFKLYSNGILKIIIEEKEPYMLWKISNKKKIIDEKANILNYDKFGHKNLITINGYIDKNKFLKLNDVLKKNKKFKKNIKFIFFSENIGWKILLKDSTCLQLPLNEIDQILNVFKEIQDSQIYSKYRSYDMRILERVYIKKNHKCLAS